MDDYDVYTKAVEGISAMSSTPVPVMTRPQFDEAVKHASIIEWDAAEEARYGSLMHALDVLK